MRQNIEDLEALRDLNDELEENHVEAERQLNTEIGKLAVGCSDEADEEILSMFAFGTNDSGRPTWIPWCSILKQRSLSSEI